MSPQKLVPAALGALAAMPVFIASTLPAAAQTGYAPYYGHGMMWRDGPYGGFGMFLGPLFFLLVLAALVVGVIAIIRWMDKGRHTQDSAKQGPRALDLLKERYARGEIDSEEFEERKRIIQAE
ncbi:hypothetical protein D1F64_14545 [Breoghania sp. L-A4]|nr:hypothetical protein D1F64_14545 [Breoghania sp. L-A4]